MPSREELLDALELGSLALPSIEGKAWFLDVPGLCVRASTLSHFFINLAARARLSAAEAEGAIERVVRYFAERQQAFGWMVGPRSTPSDLRQRLERAGLSLYRGSAGLALTDLARPIPGNAEVRVRRATLDDIELFDRLKSASFEISLEAAHWIDEIVLNGTQSNVRAHIAFLGDLPVAFGQTFYSDTRIAILGGSGTIPEARGRGVFRTLLAQRLADARDDGMQAATIQAFEDTSAPICARLGFEELGRLWLYYSIPPA